MSVLRIALRLDGSFFMEPPQVAVRIRPLGSRGPKAPRTSRMLSVPVSSNPADWCAPIELAPGAYVVEAMAPSGDRASTTVYLRRGQQVDLPLCLDEPSRHEWLAWSYLAGRVPGQARYQAWEAEVTAIPQAPELSFLEESEPGRDREGVRNWDNRLNWEDLARTLDAGSMASLPLHPRSLPESAFRADRDSLMRRVVLFPEKEPATRLWGLSNTGHHLELTSVPVIPAPFYLRDSSEDEPWRREVLARAPAPAPVEILLSSIPDPTGFQSLTSLLHPSLAPAIAYQMNGAPELAVRALPDAKDPSPLERLAAAYIALLSADPVVSEQAITHSLWQLHNSLDWVDPVVTVENKHPVQVWTFPGGETTRNEDEEGRAHIERLLHEGHRHHAREDTPGLADLNIIRACLQLRKPRKTEEDEHKAAYRLVQAFYSGIPLFSWGVRLLLDGFDQFSDRFPEMFALLRKVGRRIDLQQPFTTIRLPVGAGGNRRPERPRRQKTASSSTQDLPRLSRNPLM